MLKLKEEKNKVENDVDEVTLDLMMIKYIYNRVADPAGFHPDLDPISEKKNPDPNSVKNRIRIRPSLKKWVRFRI